MLSSSTIGILLMLASATLMSLGYVYQKREITHLPDLDEAAPWVVLRLLASRPVWVVAYLVNLIGMGFNVAALSVADVSVVQPFVGFGMVTLILAARWLLDERLTRRMAAGCMLVVVGITAVGYWAQESRVYDELGAFRELFLTPAAIATQVGLVLLSVSAHLTRSRGALGTVHFAVCAGSAAVLGLSFGKATVLNVMLQESGTAIGDPWTHGFAFLSLFFGAGAVVLQQIALQQGTAIVAVAVSNVATILLPVTLALWVFQERVPPIVVLPMLLICAGVLLLAET